MFDLSLPVCPFAESIRLDHNEQKRLPSLSLYLCINYKLESTGFSAMTGSSLRVSKLAKRGRSLSPIRPQSKSTSSTHSLGDSSGPGTCVFVLTIGESIGSGLLFCACAPEQQLWHQDDMSFTTANDASFTTLCAEPLGCRETTSQDSLTCES